jgi:hypothetical protein
MFTGAFGVVREYIRAARRVPGFSYRYRLHV